MTTETVYLFTLIGLVVLLAMGIFGFRAVLRSNRSRKEDPKL
jgi:hypothetical protein